VHWTMPPEWWIQRRLLSLYREPAAVRGQLPRYVERDSILQLRRATSVRRMTMGRTLKAMPASAQERSPKRPSAGRQNAERPSLRFTSVYSALAIVASGVLPLRCTRPRCSAIRVISPARNYKRSHMLYTLDQWFIDHAVYLSCVRDTDAVTRGRDTRMGPAEPDGIRPLIDAVTYICSWASR